MTGGPRLRARLMLLGSAVSFAAMAVLARLLSREGVPAAARFDAGQLTVIRFASGALVSLLAFRLRPGLYRPRNRRLLWTRGVSGGIVVVLYFLALGLVLATAGVALVLGGGTLGIHVGAGEALALAAAFFAAVSAVTIRAMRDTDNAPTIFFFFCLGGLPVALPFALGAWPTEGRAWALAAAMGLASYLAQLLMTEAYGALSVPEAAAWLQLTPMAQALLGAWVLAEPVTGVAAAGFALGVAGVAWATALGPRSAPAPPVAP